MKYTLKLFLLILIHFLSIHCSNSNTKEGNDNKYNQETFQIMGKVLKKNSVAVDVGSFKGEILKKMCDIAPNGTHYAFEPIPYYYRYLRKRFSKKKVKIFNLALSNKKGIVDFFHLLSNEPYSGFQVSKENFKTAKTIKIKVNVDTLDNLIPENEAVHFIKIDVEGAQFLVLRGGEKTIRRNKPVIIFEHGKESLKYYHYTNQELYQFFIDKKMKINLMSRWLNNEKPLTFNEFNHQVNEEINYYFIAY